MKDFFLADFLEKMANKINLTHLKEFSINNDLKSSILSLFFDENLFKYKDI